MNKNAHPSDWKEQRRLRALALKRAGWTHEEVAEALGVSKGAVSQWMRRVAAAGEKGLRTHHHPGAIPKLTPAQQHRLPDLLSPGAEAYGFRGEFWNSARVREVIRHEFQVSYHKHYIARLLRALGWTPQQPLEQAAQRDEARIAHWRLEVWPTLKKKPTANIATPSLSMKPPSTCCQGSSTPGHRGATDRACGRGPRTTICR
jgi:transposase